MANRQALAEKMRVFIYKCLDGQATSAQVAVLPAVLEIYLKDFRFEVQAGE